MRTFYFAGIVVLLMLTSCGKREIRIDPGTKRKIDSTASKQAIALRPQLDSLCKLRYDSLFSTALDSIIERRELEARKIVGE